LKTEAKRKQEDEYETFSLPIRRPGRDFISLGGDEGLIALAPRHLEKNIKEWYRL